tara:strand:+ start:17061 stop:18392 length:1332 start_codon:yes stop_codon:yes gene_type:complete
MKILKKHSDSHPLKKVLIIGNGGRENSLAWAFCKSEELENVFITPGNGGSEEFAGCSKLDVQANNVEEIIYQCLFQKIDLVVIGPEAPLANGLADSLRESGIAVFGPSKEGAQLEASKDWAKQLMQEAQIPTAKHWTVNNVSEALGILNQTNMPLVVKADGLAAGKGVAVPENINETIEAIKNAFEGKFGDAGEKVVLEEKLRGPEVSIFALCDGTQMIILPPAQDHKRLKEGDKGPNTGGMGAYAPAPLVDEVQLKEIKKTILEPTLEALNNRGIDYRGVIYAGLMLTESGPKVIEFNCRFGDPECQTLMPLLGPELAQVLHACAIGDLAHAPKLSIHDSCSVCIVAAASGYPERPRKGDSVKIKPMKEKQIQLFHAGTDRNPEGEVITSGGRVLSIVAQGRTFDEAFSIAYKGLKNVDFKDMQYRFDIGHQVRNMDNPKGT